MPSNPGPLSWLHADMSQDRLYSVCYFIGGCAARGEAEIISLFYDRARQLRREIDSKSNLQPLVKMLIYMIEGYLSALEPTQRLERLAHELEQMESWRNIMQVLFKSESEILGLQAICEQLRSIMKLTTEQDVEWAKEISLQLYELRRRELVECMLGEDDPELSYSLTRLGRNLCIKCQIS